MRVRRTAASLGIAMLALAGCSSSTPEEVSSAPEEAPAPTASLGDLVGSWEAVPERGITLSIAADGRVDGVKVCTPFTAVATFDEADQTLTITDFASDAVSCGEPGDSDWEEFTQIVSEPVTLNFATDELTLAGGLRGTVTLARTAP